METKALSDQIMMLRLGKGVGRGTPQKSKNQPLLHQITIFPILGGPKIKENRYPEVPYFACLFEDPKKSILVGPPSHLGSIPSPTWTQLDSNMASKRTPKSIQKSRKSNLGSQEAPQYAWVPQKIDFETPQDTKIYRFLSGGPAADGFALRTKNL